MPKLNFAGFSLVEILVAVSITSIVAAVAIPNIRKFAEDQEARNTASSLVADLREMQSNAQTGLKCPSGTTALSWKITLGVSSYQKFCTDSTSNQSISTVSLSNGVTLVTDSSTCPSTDITFNKNTISQDCLMTVTGSSGIQIDVNVTKGGTIY